MDWDEKELSEKPKVPAVLYGLREEVAGIGRLANCRMSKTIGNSSCHTFWDFSPIISVDKKIKPLSYGAELNLFTRKRKHALYFHCRTP